MRDALRKSEADAVGGRLHHQAGDVVLCCSCAKPLFVLERGIALGDRAGRLVDAFAPITPALIEALSQNRTLDVGVRAWCRSLDGPGRKAHCDRIQRPKTGDPMQCPHCLNPWVQVLTAGADDTLDRAYTLELVTVPVVGRAPAVKGRRVGARAGWVH